MADRRPNAQLQAWRSRGNGVAETRLRAAGSGSDTFRDQPPNARGGGRLDSRQPASHARLCQWSAERTPPDYANALAQCDRFIVTGDSISMICDGVREGVGHWRSIDFRSGTPSTITGIGSSSRSRRSMTGNVRSGLLAALLKRVVDSRIIRLLALF
ncbi:MAG: mitochondrial fission ELM1 family protein [Gammaproteobacteria bacterium]|nr:mitochondrial fission ELM1 family protein [Gammaproteobacteria bacterium]